ncbi:MAG: hypothetical protein AAGK78_01550 [Planctomycetota bacterium]
MPDSFAVDEWLEMSRPRQNRLLLWLPPLAMVALTGSLLLAMFGGEGEGRFPTLSVVLLAVALGVIVYFGKLARDARGERDRVKSAEDLVSLRRWPEAIETLDETLTRPMRLSPLRRSALLSLMRVLSRYGHYDDAIVVADEILDHPAVDPATGFAVRCGRAMSLLQAGRLADASDAIGALRRDVKQVDAAVRRRQRAREEGEPEAFEGDQEPESFDHPSPEQLLTEQIYDEALDPPPAVERADTFDSAAVSLIELYRDVQTYHTGEALQTFTEKRELFRDQLGLRFGDALALAAVAAQRNDQPGNAAQWWHDATLLIAEAELLRRYPETRGVSTKHAAATWPSEQQAAEVR